MLIVLYWEKEFNFQLHSLLLLLWGDVYYRVYWILLLCSLDLCWNGFIVSSCCAHVVCGKVGFVGFSAICELSWIIKIQSHFNCIYLQKCFIKITFHSSEQTHKKGHRIHFFINAISACWYNLQTMMQSCDYNHVFMFTWLASEFSPPFMWHQSSIMHGLG